MAEKYCGEGGIRVGKINWVEDIAYDRLMYAFFRL